YYARAALDDIHKTDDKGVSDSLVYNGGNRIMGMWLDSANSKLYFIEWTGSLPSTTGDLIVKYIDLSDDSITTIGTFNNVGASDLWGGDVILGAGGTIFIIVNADDDTVIVAHWGGAAWVIDDTQAVTSPVEMNAVIKTSDTVWYWMARYVDGGDVFGMFKYDNGTTTITKLDSVAGIEPFTSQFGMPYDGDNIISVIINIGGTNKLHSYDISGDSLVEIAPYDIAFQLDRFTASGILEKAYHISEDKIYEINTKKTTQLYLISIVPTDTVWKAITTNFIINSGGEVFEFIDIDSFIIELVITMKKMSHWTATMSILNTFLIGENMFISITDRFTTAANSPFLYRGTYNFKDELGIEGTAIGFVDS
ncbi:hypothetical protein LCGC14_3001670, partial [marine sediment metagenome]